MFIFMLLVLCFGGNSYGLDIVVPGPKYPPTKGEVWPKPQEEHKGQLFYFLDLKSFNITATAVSCKILTNNVNRYMNILNNLDQTVEKNRHESLTKKMQASSLPHSGQHGFDPNYRGAIGQLEVILTEPCETYPHLDMDENYELIIGETCRLNSSSIWGIIRGLETLTQLFYVTDDFSEIRINATHIVDAPKYPHRGLMLDTSRHYISLDNILLSLDAMAMNKMNVLHWHIVDDQSFPYQSEKFPSLSEFGAYNPRAVYTKENIQTVVEAARDRGIRVIPEFDVPGHTASWGKSYPSILTECFRGGEIIGLGPMDPINNYTYTILQELFKEVHDWFPDMYLHVGGDEVEMGCWGSNPKIVKYMDDHKIYSVRELHALFMRSVMPLLPERTSPIVWQEVFDNGVPLTNETIVQVWKGWEDAAEMRKIVNSGHRVLYSAAWYLDHLDKNWQSMYQIDPRHLLGAHPLASNVIGGEACIWAEMVDDTNLLSRVWPRASAVAERLWSAPETNLGVPQSQRRLLPRPSASPSTHSRLEEHVCRMRVRGVPASPPSGPGFCNLAPVKDAPFKIIRRRSIGLPLTPTSRTMLKGHNISKIR